MARLPKCAFCNEHHAALQACANDLNHFYNQENIDDDDERTERYCIYWHESFVLIIGYIIYAVTCAYYQKIMALFCPDRTGENDELEGAELAKRGSESRVSLEPSANFKSEKGQRASEIGAGTLIMAAMAPPHVRNKILSELDETDGDANIGDKFRCFLFKRSKFYKYFATASNAWYVSRLRLVEPL